MVYLTALKAGLDEKIVAHDFAEELIRKSKDLGTLCLKTTFKFIDDTLLAMGITGKITLEQIENQNFNYEWPKELLQVYSFHYNQFEFNRVEIFMVAFCSEMDKQNIALVNESTTNVNFDWERDAANCPLELLTDVLSIWCYVYNQLLNVDTCGTTNMFVEPLARINYHLFYAINHFRRKYPNLFPVMGDLCKYFYKSVLQGLRYPQVHDMIVDGLLEVFDKHLEFLQEEAILFFHEVFMIEYEPTTYIKLYTYLQEMLEKCNDNRLKILTDILLRKDMLEIYYSTLVARTGKDHLKQQTKALQFLNILQSKLLALDCFSRGFLESILCLVLHPNTSIANLACNVYITMMTRKVSEEVILKHIIEFYAAHTTFSLQLKDYISHIYNNFTYIHNVHNVLKFVSSPNSTKIVRWISCHIVVIIIEITTKKSDSASQAIEPFIQILPELLETIPGQRNLGILLGVLKFVSFETLQQETIDNFVHYACEVFKQTAINFQYALLMNIFNYLDACLNVTKQWHYLELLSASLITEYGEIIKKLESIDEKKCKEVPRDLSRQFNGVLKRINIIIKSNYEIFDFLPSLLTTLEKYVLDDDSLVSRKRSSSLTDLYALGIYVSGIIKLAKRESEETISTSLCFKKGVELLKYLEIYLENIEEFVKLPAFRMKVYFCGILNLLCHLPLTLHNNTYHRMTQILIALLRFTPPGGEGQDGNGDETQQCHPLESMEYYRLMFRHFTEMHKFKHIQIKSNVVWKLCLHYGKPHIKFNEELKQLLITLATHRLNIYKHINAVLIYNLYKQQPPLKNSTIVLLLKRHRNLIDNEMDFENPHHIKISIVLMVLQVVEKSLRIQRVANQSNRLVAMKHLHIFLKDLDLNAMEAKSLLMDQLTLIEQHLMSGEEIKIFINCRQEMQNL